MGLLENLAAAAIRNRVVAELRQHCPEGLKDALEQLLGSKEAVSAIQQFAMDARAGKASVTQETLLALPLPGAIRELLQATPQLCQYLVRAASALAPKDKS